MGIEVINTKTSANIKENRLEDLKVLEMINDILLFRRGYIFKLPSPGSSVVAGVSGGLDSVINLAVLMEELKLKVYPFFINRGQTNYKWEKKSIQFFNNYYKKRYPKQYNDCLEIKLNTPANEYKDFLRETKNLGDNSFLRNTVAYPARNPIIALTGMEYAYSLQSQKIYIKTIFTTHTADDPVLHSSLTVLRTDNLLMCQITDDYNWSFTSIPIEVELQNYYGKSKYIKWGAEKGIPLENTRSCYKDCQDHCGICFPACVNRREAFEESGVKDLTKYIHN